MPTDVVSREGFPPASKGRYALCNVEPTSSCSISRPWRTGLTLYAYRVPPCDQIDNYMSLSVQRTYTRLQQTERQVWTGQAYCIDREREREREREYSLCVCISRRCTPLYRWYIRRPEVTWHIIFNWRLLPIRHATLAFGKQVRHSEIHGRWLLMLYSVNTMLYVKLLFCQALKRTFHAK